MSTQNLFSLIALSIVISILSLHDALPISGLLRARVSAQESQAIGDSRTVTSSEVAYGSSAGGVFGAITCLSDRVPTSPNSRYDWPSYLDPGFTKTGVYTKGNYSRSFDGSA